MNQKRIGFFILFVLISGLSFSQNYQWITPNKNYLKLSVIEDGIYRITRSEFTSSGINTSSIDPRTVKVFYFFGEQDGSFDAGDYLDFYGTRNYGGATNTYLASLGPTVLDYVTNEYFDQYSDTNAYWIGWDGNNGSRYGISSYSVQTPFPNSYSFEKIHFEKDSVYSLGLTDFRYFNNEKISGEGWFWRNLIASGGYTLTRSFNIPLLSPVNSLCSFRVFAFPNSYDTSFNEHKLILKINSTVLTTLVKDDYNRFDTTITFQSSLLQQNSPNDISVTYQPTFGNPSATPSLYLDLMEMSYPKTFTFQNSHCRIEFSSSDTASALFAVNGFNSSNPLSIYDTKNNLKITNISSNDDTLFFTGKQNGTFEIINQDISRRPFRTVSRQVPDLVSSSNGADYIIIYNRLFESQSEQLRQHRASRDGFRSYKAAIEDITDIFNYGMESPIAIRRFVNHAFNNWQQPVVSYVCLMGRGSLDPKNNRSNQSYYRNLVPVYGNPTTDGYFVNFNFNGFSYIHQTSIGRLPVYTPQEAQDVVDKIIQYDSEQPQTWWKNFIMITGGPTRNEQIQYQTQSNFFVNTYINPPPLSSVAAKIYRNDSAGFITFNYADSIKREINRGGIVVNFIGHAASQDWELGLEDPFTLANGNKLPFVMSMTCYTGKNSEPNLRGFGEKFIYADGKGAIGFLGSTGWSFSSTGNQFNDHMFRGLSQDTIRRLGKLLKYANNSMAADTSSFQVRNMINCYELLGDPASKLLIPSTPEFVIGGSDYRITNQYPLVGEIVTLTIFPKNYGVYAPDCLVRFEILKNGAPFRFKDTLLTGFAYMDTASYTFSIDNKYPLENPSNNVLQLPLPLRNISFTPLKPIYNSIIPGDSVEFVGLNPQVDLRTNNVKIILQVDTNQAFAFPLLNFANSNISGVATRVAYRIPIPDTNIVYYWRTNSIINNDSTGWSETMRFAYNPLSGVMDRRSVSNDSIVNLYTRLPGQFKSTEISGLYYTGTGYKLNDFTGELRVKSYGSNGSEASFFIINGFAQFIDGGNNPGLNLVKVRKLTGSFVEFRNFRMNAPSSSDSVLNFLNTFDTTHYVMIGIATHVAGSDSLKQTAKNKIKQFGSSLIDSVHRFDVFDSYAFIGFIGAQPLNTSEAFHRYASNGVWTPSFANLTPVFLSTEGTINFSIGPAHRWKYFSWNRILTGGSSVTYDVTAFGQNGQPVQLYTGLSNNVLMNLDTINSFQYPNLRLTARLQIDTLSGLQSPEFRSMYFRYTPPAEIIPDNYSFIKSDSIVNEGAEVTISVKNYNVGFVPAGTVVYRWLAAAPQGVAVLKSDTITVPLMPDSSVTSIVTFNTSGMKEPSAAIDTLEITFEVFLLGSQNDYYPFNNFAFTDIVIMGDSTGPSIDVTYDGERILEGDFIASNPEVAFKFFDDSKLQYGIEDTANIYIRLDGRRIFYNIGSQPNPEIIFTAPNDGNLKTLVTFKPVLTEGDHVFQFFGTDKDGNRSSDTDRVYVSYAFQVRNLFNYPNPMNNETFFTFNLLAADAPETCRIKIYTVAGRLIKDISSPARVGFNQIHWDGRDNDGEYMANGIYLYKLLLEGSGKTETSIQKLAILR
jgi:Peptidase family C25/Interleukin-like EMT inducer/FlgD Ig-like domain